MSSDSFFLRVKKLSEGTKGSFTFLSAFINTELRLLTLEKLQCFRASCKRQCHCLRLTKSKATWRSQISVKGDLGRRLISSSADALSQLPRHGEWHWSQADVPATWARGGLATPLRALLLVQVGQVPDYLLNVLSNFCSSNFTHATTAVSLSVASRLARWKRASPFLPERVNLHKDSSTDIPWLVS